MYIIFRTKSTDSLEIPYGKGVFIGGTNTDKPPCTRNGFFGSKEEIIPEWRVKNEGEIAPVDGAELHQVIKGKDTIIAIYENEHFVKVPE